VPRVICYAPYLVAFITGLPQKDLYGDTAMAIYTKRIYENPVNEDGYRVLVDQLWPRGLKKEDARIDRWVKEIAPTTELRKWYSHDPEKWTEFRRRYFEELDQHPETVSELVELARKRKITFLFSSKETNLNNASALKEYIENKLKP
jgi:uncharacterized protein YeaO (DUF488 family)